MGITDKIRGAAQLFAAPLLDRMATMKSSPPNRLLSGLIWQVSAKALLRKIADGLKSLSPVTAEAVETLCKTIAESEGVKLGKVMMPLRAALTGTTSSPSLFHAIAILGTEETLRRIASIL